MHSYTIAPTLGKQDLSAIVRRTLRQQAPGLCCTQASREHTAIRLISERGDISFLGLSGFIWVYAKRHPLQAFNGSDANPLETNNVGDAVAMPNACQTDANRNEPETNGQFLKVF